MKAPGAEVSQVAGVYGETEAARLQYGQRIEDSAATNLSAAFTQKLPNLPVVLIFSGGNIQPELHVKIAG